MQSQKSIGRFEVMKNTFGNSVSVTLFGESHGEYIGAVIDGLAPGIGIDCDYIAHLLTLRRPVGKISTPRCEKDEFRIVSGVVDDTTTGTPITILIPNENVKSGDYSLMSTLARPSHADYTYTNKYGERDHRGGGRSSARITISRCVAGALAKLALQQLGISICAYTSQVGGIKLERDYRKYDLTKTETNAVRCPDTEKAAEMEQLISEVKAKGDTIGGIITCVIKGCPAGLGEPEFGKLHAALGSAMLSINAVKGFEYGEGFDGVNALGSEQNDVFTNETGGISTRTNHSGGIQGGISNGEDIYFRVEIGRAHV